MAKSGWKLNSLNHAELYMCRKKDKSVREQIVFSINYRYNQCRCIEIGILLTLILYVDMLNSAFIFHFVKEKKRMLKHVFIRVVESYIQCSN